MHGFPKRAVSVLELAQGPKRVAAALGVKAGNMLQHSLMEILVALVGSYLGCLGTRVPSFHHRLAQPVNGCHQIDLVQLLGLRYELQQAIGVTILPKINDGHLSRRTFTLASLEKPLAVAIVAEVIAFALAFSLALPILKPPLIVLPPPVVPKIPVVPAVVPAVIPAVVPPIVAAVVPAVVPAVIPTTLARAVSASAAASSVSALTTTLTTALIISPVPSACPVPP
mmetsp:Transcript_3218/g.7809  ORF Transcript_3218/g.7809 Transcript_3218/m.7809 type:complete len:226 (+) Transcript_3218:1635-2312(+)